jgi:addiction module RelE/StbE family toxin
MQIYLKKIFVKQYEKLRKSDQRKVDLALVLFEKAQNAPQLNNHSLIGKLLGKRPISARFNLRIVFKVKGGYVTVILLAVGTHNQVY